MATTWTRGLIRFPADAPMNANSVCHESEARNAPTQNRIPPAGVKPDATPRPTTTAAKYTMVVGLMMVRPRNLAYVLASSERFGMAISICSTGLVAFRRPNADDGDEHDTTRNPEGVSRGVDDLRQPCSPNHRQTRIDEVGRCCSSSGHERTTKTALDTDLDDEQSNRPNGYRYAIASQKSGEQRIQSARSLRAPPPIARNMGGLK